MAGAALPRRLTWLVAEVSAIVDETARAKSIALVCPGWPGHLAGQHVDIRLTAPDGYQAQRSYSIATPEDRDAITITVERVTDGEVSPFLLDVLQVGDRLELRGPIGGYFVWDPQSEDRLLLVGGGSGLVPLMAMVRAHAATSSAAPLRLLASARSYDDLLYRDELARVAGEAPHIDVTITLTRLQPPGWPGHRRRVDRAMLADVAWHPDEAPVAYVCGPTGFVEAVATGLIDLGHEPHRIRTERFGPTGGTT